MNMNRSLRHGLKVRGFLWLLCFLMLSQPCDAGLKIYYLRHADGKESFTPAGQAQVAAATEKLKQYHFDFIAVSTLWRARHTLLPYLQATGAKAEVWPELTEMAGYSLLLSPNLPPPAEKVLDAGDPIQLPADETPYLLLLPENGTHAYKLRPSDDAAHNADLKVVQQSVIDRIHKRFGGTDKTILLVGHGNSGHALLKMLTNDASKDYMGMLNVKMWMVEEQPDGHFKLQMFNDGPPSTTGPSTTRPATRP